tara:strand:+ start:144 stop:431 length:288 start_codon:yes stop_codon:yes gene_type:complete
MSAYVVFEIVVNDPKGYEEYKKLAPPSIASYGGKYIVRGGKVENLEGEWQPKRIVILEFESFEKATQWHDSEEYREAKALRHKFAKSNMIVIEGV